MAASSVRSSSHGDGAFIGLRSGSAVGKEATSATFLLTPLFAKEKPPSRYATRHETTDRPAAARFAFRFLHEGTGRGEAGRRPSGGYDASGRGQKVADRPGRAPSP